MGYVYKRFAAAGRFVALLIVISAFGAAIPVMGALKSGKTYVISPAGDKSKALFVMNSSMEDYAPVVLWTNTDVPAQQWRAATEHSRSRTYTQANTSLTATALCSSRATKRL